MRHRKVKNLDQRIEKTRHYIVENPKENKGKWREFFAEQMQLEHASAGVACGEIAPAATGAAGAARQPLYIEIGCGKGKFLCARAQAAQVGAQAAQTYMQAGAYEMQPAGDPSVQPAGDQRPQPAPPAIFLGIEGLDAVLIRGLERAEEEQIANIRFIMEYVSDIRDYFEDGEVDGIYLNFSDPWPKPRHEKRRFTYGNTLLKYKQILKPGGFVAFKTDNEELFEYSLGEVERLAQEGLAHSDAEGDVLGRAQEALAQGEAQDRVQGDIPRRAEGDAQDRVQGDTPRRAEGTAQDRAIKLVEMSRDLHASGYDAKEFTTEYEEKFHGKGKNINYLKIEF